MTTQSNTLLGSRQGEIGELLSRGIRFLMKGKPTNALRAFEDALRLNPNNAVALCQRGNALADLGQFPLAIENYDRAIALDPRFIEAHDFKGVALARTGQLEQALLSVERALSIAPYNFNALNNRANLLRDLGRLEEALDAFDIVIRVEPRFPIAYSMRAHTLAALGRHDEAVREFERAVEANPNDIEARVNIGTALLFAGQAEAGIAAFRAALVLNPNHVDCLANLGKALASRNNREEAEELFRRCIGLQPDHLDAVLGLGLLLSQQMHFDEGGRCFQTVLKVDLNNRPALHGLARAMEAFGQNESALVCYDHLLSFDPDDAPAHRKRGQVLMFMSRHVEAIEALDRATALDPAMKLVTSRFFASMLMSDWSDFDQRLDDVRAAIDGSKRDTMAFPILSVVDDPDLHLRSSRLVAKNGLSQPSVPLTNRYPRHEKIRIGYFSADFHHHATMQLLIETLEQHDRDRFEMFGFCFGGSGEDEVRLRVRSCFDKFVSVQLVDDRAVAQLAREMEIDIAIDLKGYTHDGRFGIFAERAAPIQASYLGYPGTSGDACIDYLIADELVIHPDARNCYSENIIYLPGSYQPNRAIQPSIELATRQSAGLPDDAFVFCCFNQNYKITPSTFAVWMDILQQVEGSVLWLWVDRDIPRENLAKEAAARGIDSSRLIFATAKPLPEHLDRMRLADLFLDTSPYNAHTSGSDALRAGVPILTCAGKCFASRVGASLLSTMGLPELIVDNFADYEALAVALAKDKPRLAAIREALEANRITSSLFDPRYAARKLEAAYVEMYRLYQEGLPPADIHISV